MENCCICFENRILTKLDCKHSFCIDCIKCTFENITDPKKRKCPLCNRIQLSIFNFDIKNIYISSFLFGIIFNMFFFGIFKYLITRYFLSLLIHISFFFNTIKRNQNQIVFHYLVMFIYNFIMIYFYTLNYFEFIIKYIIFHVMFVLYKKYHYKNYINLLSSFSIKDHPITWPIFFCGLILPSVTEYFIINLWLRVG